MRGVHLRAVNLTGLTLSYRKVSVNLNLRQLPIIAQKSLSWNWTSILESIHFRIVSQQTFSMSASFEYDNTCDPTMGAHELRVKTFLMNGSLSPWFITMFAI